MFSIEFSSQSKKFLKGLDKNDTARILTRLEKLKLEQVPRDAKFIGRESNEMVFRYRIGDYRALYKIKHSEQIVLIVKIDKRPRVYN